MKNPSIFNLTIYSIGVTSLEISIFYCHEYCFGTNNMGLHFEFLLLRILSSEIAVENEPNRPGRHNSREKNV